MGLRVANQTSFKKGNIPIKPFKKGHIPWNKGQKVEDETKSARWKGDKAGYFAIHVWVNKHLGKAKECTFCLRTSEETRMEWANISKTYKRDLNDYMALCVKCHRNYDKNYMKRNRDSMGRFI